MHDGIPDAEYHADNDALSVSGAKWLLPPSTPAHFRWIRDHAEKTSDAFDFGHAFHRLVLGIGPEVRWIDAADWRTKAAKEERLAARTLGEVPMLTKHRAPLQAMAESLHAHPLAAKLLDPDLGAPEQSLYARDHDTGVMLRGRLDYLPHPTDRRMVLCDLKTADSADPERFGRSAADYGYDMQDAFYRDLVTRLKLDPDPAFVFVVIEKSPPYLVNVVQLNSDAQRIGRIKNRRAIRTYAECLTAGEWPGYPIDVNTAQLPGWYVRQFEEIIP